jgi:hypothetical protein
MPITFRFFLFARPALDALKLVRFEARAPQHGPPAQDVQQARLAEELAKRLPPHLQRDVLRDE